MKLLYFTSGTSLLDEQVRRQLVRIPEVLSEIRKVKLPKKIQSHDAVMAFLGLNYLVEGDLQASCDAWAQIVQRGIFNRLRNSGFKYSGVIKRSKASSAAALESMLCPILRSKTQLEIYVVGPGFDDLKFLIDQIQRKFHFHCEVVLIDVLTLDQKLRWFWSEIANQSPGLEFPQADLSRH